jgi:hypothetical protein
MLKEGILIEARDGICTCSKRVSCSTPLCGYSPEEKYMKDFSNRLWTFSRDQILNFVTR